MARYEVSEVSGQLLAEIREQVDATLRTAKFRFGRKPPMLERPAWTVKMNDRRFDAIFQDQGLLRAEGRVRWAAVVQANTELFAPSNYVLPLFVVFADHDAFDVEIAWLREMAGWLYGLKTTNEELGDVFLQELQEVLRDEYVCPMNVRIPEDIVRHREPVYCTTLLVDAAHLPGRRLVHSWFPILTLPEKTSASIIVPPKAWSPQLLSIWTNS